MKKIIKPMSISAILLSVTLIFNSCVSYDSTTIGVVGQVAEVSGIKILVDSGTDALVAVAIRNDGNRELEVNLRAVGGDIGYDIYGRGGFSNYGRPSTKTRAGWITNPPYVNLRPGEEEIIVAHLNNWTKANINFRSRIDVIIKDGDFSHRLSVDIDEHNVFSDPKRIFQENKLGTYDPSRYSARYSRFGDLPQDYQLTIPENE